MWELCSLPSAPRPHHPGRCVYRVDFFGMYLWQSVALFCQGHGARLFPRFTVLKKKKKRKNTHFVCKTLCRASRNSPPRPWTLGSPPSSTALPRCLSTSPGTGRFGSSCWLATTAPSLHNPPRFAFWVFSGRKHGCVFPEETWRGEISTKGSSAEQPWRR